MNEPKPVDPQIYMPFRPLPHVLRALVAINLIAKVLFTKLFLDDSKSMSPLGF